MTGIAITMMLAALAPTAACGGGGAADADADPDGAPGEDDAAYLFDDGALRTYELVIAPADWAWLQANARLEQYVRGTLRLEGREVTPVGVRFKGGFGTLGSCFDGQGNQTCPKLSMKVSFNEYVPDGAFFGVRKLNFHSMLRDPSHLHDRLGYSLFRDAGVAAPRAVHARLVINGEPQGLFALVEQVDGRFTRDRFADGGEGNLYKEVWPVHTAPTPYLQALETNEDEMPSVDRMVRFATELAAAGDAGFRDVLARWMDLPALMRYLAVDRAIDSWDGIVAWYCVGGPCFNHNYYWYEATDADRVWLVPWDLDNAFQLPSPIRATYGMPDWNETAVDCTPIPLFAGIYGQPPACDAIMRRLATVTWDDYAAASRELLDTHFALATLEAKLARWETQIEAAVAEDPNGPGTAAWRSAVDDLRADLPALRARVEAQIAP